MPWILVLCVGVDEVAVALVGEEDKVGHSVDVLHKRLALRVRHVATTVGSVATSSANAHT